MAHTVAADLEAVTFDCYGTIVDWERGLLDSLSPLLRRHHCERPPEEVLALYARLEAEAEAGPFRPYRQVLGQVVASLGSELGFTPTQGERSVLVESLPRWPPFPDSVPALRTIGARHALAVISNVDDDLFAGTCARLGWSPHLVVTAQSVGHYKPDPSMFSAALHRLDLRPPQVLHVGCSRFHDIAPAAAAGMRTCLVDRRAGGSGGATPASSARADLTVRDLGALARILGQ